MRYRIGDDPTSGTTVTDDMLLFTVILSLAIGNLLVWIARRGRQMWLLVWSAGLVLSSIAYVGWIMFVSQQHLGPGTFLGMFRGI